MMSMLTILCVINQTIKVLTGFTSIIPWKKFTYSKEKFVKKTQLWVMRRYDLTLARWISSKILNRYRSC